MPNRIAWRLGQRTPACLLQPRFVNMLVLIRPEPSPNEFFCSSSGSGQLIRRVTDNDGTQVVGKPEFLGVKHPSLSGMGPSLDLT